MFDRTAFATGDCSTDSEDHHGTPPQRACAAMWGASMAAPDHVPVLDPDVFVTSFNAAYMMMLNLDEDVCTLILEDTSSVEYQGGSEQGRLPSVQDVQVVNWDNNNAAGYNEHDKINLNDWLDAQDRHPHKGQQQNWGDSFETKYDLSDINQQQQQPAASVEIPDQDVVTSLVPLDNNNYSWESRGKPSSSSSLRPGAQDEDDPYRHFADRGKTPEETSESYMQHAVTVRDCHMPWVYCHSSSSNFPSLSRMIGFVSVLFAAAFHSK